MQPDILNLNGDLGGHFADRIDIDGGLVAVGAPNRSVVFDHSGAAYVFDAATGSQLTYIVPNDAHDRDNFGISISIDGGTLLVGAHQDDENGFNSGSVYFYNAFTGEELDKLIASDGEVSDHYGCSVVIDGSLAVVGAKDDDDNGSSSGSAYIYSGITLGVTDNQLETVAIYPNPTTELVTLEFGSEIAYNYTIKVYNSLGKLMEEINHAAIGGREKLLLDVSGYSSGVYFINIHHGDGFTVKKLMVE